MAKNDNILIFINHSLKTSEIASAVFSYPPLPPFLATQLPGGAFGLVRPGPRPPAQVSPSSESQF